MTSRTAHPNPSDRLDRYGRAIERATSLRQSVGGRALKIFHSRDCEYLMSSPPLICIVDDDRVLCASVADLLQAEGYRTAEFGTARAFLDSPEKDDWECVVAEIQM